MFIIHYNPIYTIISGWWYTYPSEKYEFVSWDDEIPNIWNVIKFHGSKPPTSDLPLLYPSGYLEHPSG
jgi:hypothetical protein